MVARARLPCKSPPNASALPSASPGCQNVAAPGKVAGGTEVDTFSLPPVVVSSRDYRYLPRTLPRNLPCFAFTNPPMRLDALELIRD
jgi:hypothetical protein